MGRRKVNQHEKRRKKIKRTSGGLPIPHEFKYRTGRGELLCNQDLSKTGTCRCLLRPFREASFSLQPLGNYKAFSGPRNTKPKQNSAHRDNQGQNSPEHPAELPSQQAFARPNAQNLLNALLRVTAEHGCHQLNH